MSDENRDRRRSRSSGSVGNAGNSGEDNNRPVPNNTPASGEDQSATAVFNLTSATTSAMSVTMNHRGDENVSNSSSGGVSSVDDQQQKHCWVCFATTEDDSSASWVRPCLCRGTTKWVHQTCLQRWVDEKQRGDTFARVNCSQCKAEYIIFYPPPGFFTLTLEYVERLLGKLCPVMTGLIASGTIYWCAVTYGAITVFVVLGHDDGLHLMERTDPVLLLLALPVIPVALFCTQMLMWEDDILRIIALVTMRSADRRNLDQQIADQRRLRRSGTVTRTICGALALPVISKLVGNWLFADHVHSPVGRTLLGGLAFLAVRGACNIYFRYQQLWRRRKRIILDYVEPSQPPRIV